mgnify:FL=1
MLLSGHLPGVRRRGRELGLTTTIWTIGHGDRSFDDIERGLAEHGVTMIVDVRRDPEKARNPDFGRRRLEDLAAEAVFGFRWLGSTLGR